MTQSLSEDSERALRATGGATAAKGMAKLLAWRRGAPARRLLGRESIARNGLTRGPALALALTVAAATFGAPVARAESSPYGNYLAGIIAGNHQNYDRASDFLLKALAESPGQAEIAVNAFVMAVAAGRIEEAMPLAEEVARIVPQHLIASMVLSIENFEKGEIAKADGYLAELPPRGAASLLAPLVRGWLAVEEGDVPKVADRVQPLTENEGLKDVVHIHTALMYDVAGAAEEAKAAYETAMETARTPTFRLALLTGNFYERHGETEKALALYRDFLERRPGVEALEPLIERAESGEVPEPVIGTTAEGMAEVYFDVGTLLAQEGARDMALIHARIAAYLRPDFAEATILIGETLQGLQRHESAIEAYRSVSPDSAFIWNVGLRIADELNELGKTDRAIEELRRLAAEEPNRFEPYLRIGNMLRETERFGEAATAYEQAVERIGEPQPFHWSLFYFRGIAYERSDEWDKAEADFLRALELRPEDPYVMNYLAYSWVERHSHLERAQEMLVRAVELRPEDGYIVDSLGWVYYRLGKYEQAAEQLERAIELEPQDPTINDHLGDAYWRTGRQREARVQWQRALSLDPDAEMIPKIERKLSDGMPPPEEYDYVPRTENETPALTGDTGVEANDI